jgi:hypothetical protein
MGHHAGGGKAWNMMLTNEKRRACLSIIRHVLSTIEYAGKDEEIVRQPDAPILGGTAPIGGSEAKRGEEHRRRDRD